MTEARLPDLPAGTWIVAGLFTASGITHFVRPQVFEPLIPKQLPGPRALVLISGAAELICAGSLVTRQPWAPPAATATLAIIWVGNGNMAVRWQRSPRRPAWMKAAAWIRMPLQVPLMMWAWRSPIRDR